MPKEEKDTSRNDDSLPNQSQLPNGNKRGTSKTRKKWEKPKEIFYIQLIS